MKLEEAMVYLMSSNGYGMTCDQLADAINRHHLHHRRDGQPVTGRQVFAVACRFPQIFSREEGRIRLMM